MSDFYAKCPECGHVWSVVKLPMEAKEAARRMIAAFCPVCGNDSPTTAPAAEVRCTAQQTPTAQQENDMSATIPPPFEVYGSGNYGQPPEVKTTLIDTTRADEDAAARSRGPMILHKADPARPRRQHPNFFKAHQEAARLAKQNPGAEFIISEEIARVVCWPEKSE
ncbi:hypothetical protein [Sphingopyxis macrogoltabida]|uniref:Uncharacterized protein n=1 Tax=Sphingopyxis macrogoltabida TaxID=33050 RepID=A0AAC8Z1Y7_SPHMC|nr:hypothetical protein [Sphingopyxis macrogoltabida]ALJ14087.1 hypothetical protein LH19_14530 [Sphingopyxis macrogoltabida]AMU90359.1 hypothetical protein ATM17_15135 [Sphingopyxis macrogoltabida]